MLLQSWFPLIWYAKWPCSDKVEFWPQPQDQGGGVQAEYWLPCCCIHDSFNLIWNMTIFWKSWILTFWPHSLGSWERGTVGKLFDIMLLHYLIPFNLTCYMTMFSKRWSLTYWPVGSGSGGGGSAGKIFATILLHLLFHLIWYATWPGFEKLNFHLLTPSAVSKY